jgi:hypothetical protein
VTVLGGVASEGVEGLELGVLLEGVGTTVDVGVSLVSAILSGKSLVKKTGLAPQQADGFVVGSIKPQRRSQDC